MPKISQFHQTPNTSTIFLLDDIIEVRYRASRGIKYQQRSYTTINGISIRHNTRIIIPAKFCINGTTIKDLRQDDNYWKTDTASDGKAVKIDLLGESQPHNQSTLKQLGLARNVREILNREFLFRSQSSELIRGNITSINFVSEMGRQLIQLSPRNNEAYNCIAKQWQRISYFQVEGRDLAIAFHKKSDLCSGRFELL